MSVVPVVWPFVGRDEAIDRTLDAHALHLPVLVYGGKGMGKTRFLRELPAHLGRQRTVVRAAQEAVDAELPADAVWLIDDVDGLPPDSAFALAARLRAHRHTVVMTASSPAALAPVLRSAVDSTLPIELAALDVVAVESLLRQAVGPVSGTIIAAIVGGAAGNPDLVARLVADLWRAGRLHRGVESVELLPGEEVGPELAAFAPQLLDELDESEREALRTLAVLGPCRADLLARLGDGWTALERRGVIHRVADPSDQREIALLTQPVVGPAVWASAPFGWVEETERRVISAAREAGLLGAIGTHQALNRHPGAATADQLLTAARSASRLHDFALAIELADLVDHCPDVSVLELAEAAEIRGFAWRFRWQSDDAEAEYELGEELSSPLLATDARAVAAWSRLRSHRAELTHFVRDDALGAVAQLRDSADEAARRAAMASSPAVRTALDRAANTFEAHRLLHVSWSGQHERFLADLKGFTARDPLLKRRLRAAQLVSEGITGRPRAAYRRGIRSFVRGALTSPSQTWADEELGAAVLLVSVQHNGPTAVAQVVARRAGVAQLNPFAPYDGMLVRLLMSSVAFLSGDAEEALAHAEVALTTVGSNDPAGATRIASFARAQALALVGRQREAREEVQRAAAMPRRAAAFNRGAEVRAEFVVRLCGEDAGRVLPDLRLEAKALAEEGNYGVALELLHWGVRFGDTASAQELLELREHIDSAMWGVAIEHADVLLVPDPARCLTLASRADELGLKDLAAELCALGERQADRIGAPGLAEQCRRRYAVARSLVRMPGSPLLRDSPAEPLSRRELQVARRAATGATAKQIGAELHLSRRTVEGHLARIYTKLGISHRRDLAL